MDSLTCIFAQNLAIITVIPGGLALQGRSADLPVPHRSSAVDGGVYCSAAGSCRAHLRRSHRSALRRHSAHIVIR